LLSATTLLLFSGGRPPFSIQGHVKEKRIPVRVGMRDDAGEGREASKCREGREEVKVERGY
jgi:hypothetical protein